MMMAEVSKSMCGVVGITGMRMIKSVVGSVLFHWYSASVLI